MYGVFRDYLVDNMYHPHQTASSGFKIPGLRSLDSTCSKLYRLNCLHDCYFKSKRRHSSAQK